MNRSIHGDMYHFNRLQGEIAGLYHEASQALGLSDSVSMLLYELCQSEDGLSQSELCRLCGLPKQTVHSAVRRLEQDGLVDLRKGFGRTVLICLNESGRQYAQEHIHPLIRMENEVIAEWTEEETDVYLRLTQRFRDQMKEKIRTLK